jgi:hypothetical protein
MVASRKYEDLTTKEVCEIITNYKDHDFDKLDHMFWDEFDFFLKL